MYTVHPFLAQPREDARLWRYMTPSAFLSVLLERSLFFATLASFEDPFEGVPPPAVIEAARKQRHPGSTDAGRRLQAWKQMIALCRASICASCWHAGDEESEAMWKLYGRFEDGLAIVSTLPSIKAGFRDRDVTGGLVDYSGREFDAGTTEQNLLQWATTKRPSYRHENEFRLLVRREPKAGNGNDAEGVSLPIDPAGLIEDVVLSPRMQRWQIDLFRDLLEKLHFKRPVHESSLLTSPF